MTEQKTRPPGRPKGTGAPRYVTEPTRFIPSDRVAPILSAYFERAEAERPRDARATIEAVGQRPGRPLSTASFAGVRETLSQDSGVSVRFFNRILTGESESAELAKVEAVLHAMGRQDLLYLPAEQGGLRDLYFCPEVIGDEDDGEEVGALASELLDLRPPQSEAFRAASRAHRARLGLREAA
jgi:hypothetical protein